MFVTWNVETTCRCTAHLDFISFKTLNDDNHLADDEEVATRMYSMCGFIFLL